MTVDARLTPRAIAALHLPDPVREPGLSMAWLEDYVLANTGVFAAAGIPAVKLQDQTRSSGLASIETIATMAALGRLIRKEYPALSLGIILQAHDAEGPLAVAKACGADFVRLKVYVGSVIGAEGPKHALAATARAYRQRIAAQGVAIMADVQDRTTLPIGGVLPEQAALWAESMDADHLVITGSSFADSCARIAAARRAGCKRPIVIGGGVTANNVADALTQADGVIVSTALMLKGGARRGVIAWDAELCRAFMEAAAA